MWITKRNLGQELKKAYEQGLHARDLRPGEALQQAEFILAKHQVVEREYHKGEPCPYADDVLCQEGFCDCCYIRQKGGYYGIY